MKKSRWIMTALAAAALTAGMSMTALAEGWVEKDNGQWGYQENDGSWATDVWGRDAAGQYYYLNSDGDMAVSQLIDGTYYVNENGVMVTETWVQIADDWDGSLAWYYFRDNGSVVESGWRTIGGVKYYFEDSKMVTGWQDIDDSVYYFKDSGAMATGWQYLDQRDYDSYGWGEPVWYYFSTTGKMSVSKEQRIDGHTYIFDAEGRMLTGWVDPVNFTSSKYGDVSNDINELRYHKEDGSGADGWEYIYNVDETEENWYYFRDGQAYSTTYKGKALDDEYALASIDGKTYCFRADGRMYTGLLELEDGRVYYFDEDGVMKTGRVVVNDENHDNEVFYFTSSGSLGNKGDGVTGVQNGYLYEDGALVHAEEGMTYEIKEVDGKQYLVNESGKVKTSGTARDADGVKYRVTKNSDGTYNITIEEDD